MKPKEVANLIASSTAAWIVLNKFVTENQHPIEFNDHRFLIDIYTDTADDIVGRKSAQIGWSVAEILKSIHSTQYEKRNIIYALPTNNVVQDFVKPKVNPLILSNKAISDVVTDDSVSLKKVGDRFIYFKGGFSDREAISISGDTLVIDEYDRMPDMRVVNTFDSRLQAAAHPKRRRFSNPSQIGYGVDGLFQDSTQHHWFVKCTHCNYEWYMDWEKDKGAHYVNQEAKFFACGKCDKEITDTARRNGRWVAKFPERKRHGYWFAQMMAPWVTAARIIEQYEESNIEFFHNYVLGKAYTPSDLIVNRETILRACSPGQVEKRRVVIGVDQDAGGQYWVAATPNGIFAHGKAKAWEEIEHLKLMYDAVVVCDPNPYPTQPKKYAHKYSDWYLCYFKQMDGMDVLKWNNQVVYADRTRLLDIVANEITEARLLFRERPYDLEDIIADYNNIYRTTVEKPDGKSKSEWLKKEGKLSDYPFAIAYCRIGLSRAMGGASTFVEGFDEPKSIVTDTIQDDGRYKTNLGEIIEEALSE